MELEVCTCSMINEFVCFYSQIVKIAGVTSVDAPKCTKQIVVSDSDSPQNTTSEVSRTWNSPCSLWSLGFDDCKLVVGGFDGRYEVHGHSFNNGSLMYFLSNF